ncbi:MAG: HyaD/HybD family hydrogenase maturation endopeptidase [Deltaproteobacteria bacterium]|nr:HyaD/HybD family hydrogenase maturation endopeptidase [Deltaproteobacteria bacterium]
MKEKQITILGVGNILFTDEGVGVRVLETLNEQYDFPPNVAMVDGGVLGMNLLGTISEADHLIVIDAVRNGQAPGTLYRLEGEEIPQRVLAKNSLHQVDLLEALTFCQALDKQPETLIIGVEPEDIKTVGLDMTPTVANKMPAMVEMVILELNRLGAEASRRPLSVENTSKENEIDQAFGIPRI